MRILALWIVNYYSGSTSERFVRPLSSLGHLVDVIPLESWHIESKLIEKAKNYDMLLHLPYPNTVRLEVIRNLPITTVAWCGDDEHYWDLHPKFAKDIADSHDYCITTYKPALKMYSNGILGSWGYSEDWKYRKLKKDIDIYFCGSKTPLRDRYIGALIDNGYKIVLDGPGYSGKIDLKTMIERYQRAKIGLSFVSENKDGFEYSQIKARTFEIPACGTFQLSEYCDQLSKEIISFNDEYELMERCDYFLEHDKQREDLAKMCHQENKKNSYKKIFKRCFNEITLKESYAKA